MIRSRPLRALLLVTTIALLLGGCGGDPMADLQSYVRSIKSRPPKPIEALPEVEPIATFVYEPADRRDPFTPDEETEPEEQIVPDNGLAPDPRRRKEELEGFALDSLRMVGTLDQDGILWALVRNTEGTLYRVTVGNYMGKNNGQIVSITEDAIQLTEIVSDAPGRWRERAATIALAE